MSDASYDQSTTQKLAHDLYMLGRDGHTPRTLSPTEAMQLLGNIESCDIGGKGRLIVPHSTIVDLLVHEYSWSFVANSRTVEGRTVYDLDLAVGRELVRQLEGISGKTWQQARTLKEEVDVSRSSKTLG